MTVALGKSYEIKCCLTKSISNSWNSAILERNVSVLLDMVTLSQSKFPLPWAFSDPLKMSRKCSTKILELRREQCYILVNITFTTGTYSSTVIALAISMNTMTIIGALAFALIFSLRKNQEILLRFLAGSSTQRNILSKYENRDTLG